MKNKIKLIICVYLISLFLVNNIVYSNEFNFEAKNITSVKDEIITASENVIITDNKGNQIFADQLIIDNKTRIHTILKNVTLENSLNSIKVESDKIIFDENKYTFFSDGPTKINKKNLYFIDGSNILLDHLLVD